MRLTYRLYGMYLCAFRCLIVPHRLIVLCHFCNTILMCQQDMSVGHKDGITDLTFFDLILILPSHLSFPDDKHPSLFTLSGIKEIMTVKTIVYALCMSECRQSE